MAIGPTIDGNTPDIKRSWEFPENIGNDSRTEQGHLMTIKCYPAGKADIQNTLTLFIPGGGTNTPLMWEQKYDYAEVLMTKAIAGSLGIGGIASLVNTAAQTQGRSINPKVEVLFRNVYLREFQFSFMFAPSSEKESESMKNIIKVLRYHAEPEIGGGLLGGEQDVNTPYVGNQIDYVFTGNVLKSPSEFKIDFYSRIDGSFQENPHLPKIARGVITAIDVNYAPQGQFSTFSNGHPVAAMLTFMYRELRIIGKKNIWEGGY